MCYYELYNIIRYVYWRPVFSDIEVNCQPFSKHTGYTLKPLKLFIYYIL